MRATRPILIKSTEYSQNNCDLDIIQVLVIDDDEEDYFTVKRMLESSTDTRYRTTYVSTYDAAVSALKTKKYDAVLLDYFINGKSAEDVYEAVDGRWNVPVIIFTGSADRTLEDQVLEAGAFDFLNKNIMCPESLMLSISFAIRRFQIDEKVRAQQKYFCAIVKMLKQQISQNPNSSRFLATKSERP